MSIEDTALRYKSLLSLEGASQAKIRAYDLKIDLSLKARDLGADLTGHETMEQIVQKLYETGHYVNFEIKESEQAKDF